jgi:hypothetical protein
MCLSPSHFPVLKMGRSGGGKLNKSAAGQPAAEKIKRDLLRNQLLRHTGAIRGGWAGNKATHTNI